MTEKRYFERMWEEEYYIFDSETISENEFDEKVEYEDYQAFADSMQGDEVVNKLNQLNSENKQLKSFKQRVFDLIDKTIEEETQIAENIEEVAQETRPYAKAVNRLTIKTLENLKWELQE